MTENNPFEDAMKTWSALMERALDETSPEKIVQAWPIMPQSLMEQVFGTGVNPEGLDARTRLLITITGLVCQGGSNELAIRQSVRHAIEAGASQQQVLETIALAGSFGGLPAMMRATEIARAQIQGDISQ